MTGGLGADKFIYTALADSPASGMDVITDFSHADNDTVDLHLVDVDPVKKGTQHFTFIGTAAFSANATGQLRWDAATHTLQGSTNADSAVEFAIQLTGVTTFVAHDVVTS